MFNFQGSELFIILLLALVVLGPEKLPEAMRKLGNFYAQMKKMSNSFQQEFRSVIDEPMREMRETANLLRDSTDFRKLANGDRDEKPKSGEMAAAPVTTPIVAPADPAMEPSPVVPFSQDQSVDVAAEAPEDAPPTTPPPKAPFGSHQRSSATPAVPLATDDPQPDAGAPPDAATSIADGPRGEETTA